MKRLACLILLVAILTGACDKIIDISVPDKSRKIVLNALLNPDSLVSVQLTQSKSILEDNQVLLLEEAEVELFENDQLVGGLEYEGYGYYGMRDFQPEINKSYRLEVKHPVLDAVHSEVKLPPLVPILDVDTARYLDEYDNDRYSLNVGISDPQGEDNYYAMSIAITSRVYDWNTQELTDSTETFMIYFHSIDQGDVAGSDIVQNDINYYIDDKLFISDDIFDGQDHEFALAIDYYFLEFKSDTIMLDVRLDHIDPSYYFYSVSKRKYYQADGNPFSEPVQVYNNVENGFGIMSAYTRSSKQFYIDVSGIDK